MYHRLSQSPFSREFVAQKKTACGKSNVYLHHRKTVRTKIECDMDKLVTAFSEFAQALKKVGKILSKRIKKD